MTDIPPVYLNAEQTEKFVFFMQHYDFINRLYLDGVFTLRNGFVKINIDSSGNITSTEVTKVNR